jgi:hypothetical protein
MEKKQQVMEQMVNEYLLEELAKEIEDELISEEHKKLKQNKRFKDIHLKFNAWLKYLKEEIRGQNLESMPPMILRLFLLRLIAKFCSNKKEQQKMVYQSLDKCSRDTIRKFLKSNPHSTPEQLKLVVVASIINAADILSLEETCLISARDLFLPLTPWIWKDKSSIMPQLNRTQIELVSKFPCASI